jgi:hypothetical protein
VDDNQPEQGAKGRRWKLCIALIVVGLLLLIYGVADHYLAAIIVGAALVLFFGAIGAGARKVRVGADPVRADADFDAPPPPKTSGRIFLPRGWRSKSKR